MSDDNDSTLSGIVPEDPVDDGLRFVEPLTWDEVFDIMRKNEENLSHWEPLYRSKGFSSWEDWRRKQFAMLHGDQLSWNLYRVPNHLGTVPIFHGGPFLSWMKYFYQGDPAPTFATLAQHPGIQNHYYIRDLVTPPFLTTTIVAVRNEDRIVVIEGMHRCCAIALAAAQGCDTNLRLYVALAHFKGDLPILSS